jgi:hypothetical protein
LGEFLGNFGLDKGNFFFFLPFCLMAEMSNWAVWAKTGAKTGEVDGNWLCASKVLNDALWLKACLVSGG